ncbi:DUF1016 N-terminal domain-containing protein [Pontibacter qinzhouensis]|uniref:DUF1016 N-terminal domain-containing protein n=1 Tax=Pontibacter qinzhouensis TaxID=2603253 RepID=UPI0016505422|nr:DUF1016 N-terminal domain-containing protein [Pontibacter qinzhouensis]
MTKEEIQNGSLLVNEVKQLIAHSREKVASTVSAEITQLYWLVGKHLNDEILKNSPAEYGKQIVNALPQQLTLEYGAGWSRKQLLHCIRCASIFKDEQIVSALRRQLTWTHIKTIIYLDDELKRYQVPTNANGKGAISISWDKLKVTVPVAV